MTESSTACKAHTVATEKEDAQMPIKERCQGHLKAPPPIASKLENVVHPAFDLAFVDVFAKETTRKATERAEKKLARASNDQDEELTKIWAARLTLLKAATSHNDTVTREEVLTAIRPAFQLASAILQDREQLPFCHGLMIAGRDFKCKEGDNYALRTFAAKQQLTDQEAEETLRFLRNLGEEVFIAFEVLMNREYGKTEPFPEKFIDIVSDDPKYRNTVQRWRALPRLPDDDRKHTVRIALRRGLMAECLNWRNMTVLNLQKAWFRIAYVLLHEFAHAADAFVYRGRLTKAYDGKHPFFGDETCAEVGFAYEKYVFGDMVSVDDKNGEYSVTLRSWPNQGICGAYDGLIEGGRGSSLEKRGEIPAVTHVGRTNWDCISAYFDASTWSTKSLGDGTRRLQLRRCCTTEEPVEVVANAESEQGGDITSKDRRR